MNRHEIEICMGSSCAARGNSSSLQILQAFIQENALECTVQLKGALCREQCNRGPVLRIDDVEYTGVEPGAVQDMLRRVLCKPAAGG